MSKLLKSFIILVTVCSMGAAFLGCGKKEEPAAGLRQAAEQAGEAAEDAAKEAEKAAEDAKK